MFGTPGSMVINSTGPRTGLIRPDDKLAGPADYNVTTGSIKKRSEMVAPFDTSSRRGATKYDFMPSPAAYYPVKPSRDWSGSPMMIPEFFPAEFKRGYRSTGPGPIYKPMDEFTKMALDTQAMATKKPRVNFEKFVSNSCPTIYHPQDIRCFVPGTDGRMYPWILNRRNKSPGPKYDTFGIQTSRTFSNGKSGDFSKVAKRPSLFKAKEGLGPADISIPRTLKTQGGVMLGRTSDPKRSSLRYFDQVALKTLRDHVPHPFSHSIPSCFDKYSSKAVSAPFKSRSKLGMVMKPMEGPGPAAYFKKVVPIERITDRETCGIFTTPTSIKSFGTSEPRFFTLENNEHEQKPPPWEYMIKGFADELQEKMVRHRHAKRNPKEGFLVSSERPECPLIVQNCKGQGAQTYSTSSPRRAWRNMRPKKGDTRISSAPLSQCPCS